MPVVQVRSDLFRTQPMLGQATPDPARARGRPIVAQFTVTNLSTDETGSQYLLAELPTDCILAATTWFKVDGWGFATVQIGTRTAPTAIGTVPRATAPYFRPIVEGAALTHGRYLWEILGLAADPGGLIGIFARGPANATVAGVMTGELNYRYR